MKQKLRLLASLLALTLSACGDKPSSADAPPAKPALTVTVTTPLLRDWPQTLSASGNVAAWQEAVIGPEISNYRITEVRANVGDAVKKGDVLARIASDAVDSELAESKSGGRRSRSDAGRSAGDQRTRPPVARKGLLQPATGHSDADRCRYRTGPPERGQGPSAVGRTEAFQGQRLAPDDGIISARSATVGSLTQSGAGTVPPDPRRPAGMARRSHRRRTGPPQARPAGQR